MTGFGKYLLLALGVLFLLPGCTRWEARKAAKHYADRIEISNRKLANLNRQLFRFNERVKTAKSARVYLKNDVLPLFKAYLDALKKVPTETSELQTIHNKLVAQHSALYKALSSVHDGISDENLAKRIESLKKQVRQVQTGQNEYQTSLRAYYKKHGLKSEE